MARETQLRESVWALKKKMWELPLLVALAVLRRVVERLVQHERAQDVGKLRLGVLRGEV